jgi:hypothetical protein
MADALTTAILTVLGSGVGAGAVTFGLNFWKTERDFRRAKLESLYLAVHKNTQFMSLLRLRQEQDLSSDIDKLLEERAEDLTQISLLIDLYFRELRPLFEKFETRVHAFIEHGYSDYGQVSFPMRLGLISDDGKRLEHAIVELARSKMFFLDTY